MHNIAFGEIFDTVVIMTPLSLQTIRKVYFVGIGGIGISAVARMMVHEGKIVTGTNDRESPNTLDGLRAAGVQIYCDRDISHIDLDTDLIIYSTAWDQNEKDFIDMVRTLGIPVLTYAEALGLISQNKYTIAISGTHGKTTTTAMVAKVLGEAQKKPTVIVGSILKDIQSNFIAGSSNLFVVEACEYQRSFLNLSPSILVITNIDNDHLDYYGTLDGIQKAFAELAHKVPSSGFIVCDPNDARVSNILTNLSAHIVDYTKEKITTPLKVSGDHNIKNAQAAIAVGRILSIETEKINSSLAQFTGTWRRMEYKGTMECGALVYDDYAHHPTEIRASLQGFRSMHPHKNIRVIFQPHLFSRTKFLLNEFSQSFTDTNEVILAPIYGAREKPDSTISSEILSELTKKYHQKVSVGENFSTIENYLKTTSTKEDVIITMGAGNIYKIGEKLLG